MEVRLDMMHMKNEEEEEEDENKTETKWPHINGRQLTMHS